MTIEKTTSLLFPTFPRQVGPTPFKFRGEAKNSKEFETFLISNNGIRDCYVSLYDYKFVDKLWFDFDDKEKPENSLLEAQKLVKWCINQNYFVIPIATGKKGYHVYILTHKIPIIEEKEEMVDGTLKRIESPTKVIIKNVGYTIIDKVFGHTEKNILKANTVDYALIGDYNRLVRIPNTLRPPKNNTYCTYLPLDFINWTQYDVEKHMKNKHYLTYENDKKILDLYIFEISTLDLKPLHKEDKSNRSYCGRDGESLHILLETNKYLQEILPPYLFKRIINPHPNHATRISVAVYLLQFFTVDEVMNWLRNLGWSDWDEKTAKDQVESCVGYIYDCDWKN